MQSVFDTIIACIVFLVGLVAAGVGLGLGAVRVVLAHLGIGGAAQTVLLCLAVVLLLVLALRLFGRILAVLIVAALVVYLAQVALLGTGHGGVRGHEAPFPIEGTTPL